MGPNLCPRHVCNTLGLMGENFKVKLNKRNISDEELIKDMKRVASEIGKSSLTGDDYEANGEFSGTTIRRRFGLWYKALEIAELESSQRQINNPIESLLENIADVWMKLGRQPVYQDMNQNPSQFTAKTYDNRFSSWNNALLEFSRFVESGHLPDEIEKPNSPSKGTKRTPRRINWRLRAKTLIKDSCICQMCGASPSKDPTTLLHADHIKPWSKGGETVPENLQTLCSKCNIGKNDLL